MEDNNTILPRDDVNEIAEIAQQIRDIVDQAALKVEGDVNEKINDLRKLHSSLANDFERAVSVERTLARFGTGSSSYLKTAVLHPLLEKHIGNQI